MNQTHQPVKLGAVRYLNARPLVFDLEILAPWAEVVLGTPRRLAEDLRLGRLDIGLVPSVEYLRLGQGCIVPDISITSCGEVWSVLLVSQEPLESIRTLGLDVSSLSSVALARILCLEKFHVRPRFLDSPPDVSAVGRDVDALVLIGDPAMGINRKRFPFVYDLGYEWQELTGLPFVYAFWLARTPKVDTRLVDALLQAKSRGLEKLEVIIKEESPRLGIPEETCREYLSQKISYDLGEAEVAGLRCFYELCAKHGLSHPPPPLRLAGAPRASLLPSL